MVTRHDDHSPGTKRFRVIDLVIPADAEATLPYLVEAVRRLIPADRKAAMAARGRAHDCGANPGVEQHLDLAGRLRLCLLRTFLDCCIWRRLRAVGCFARCPGAAKARKRVAKLRNKSAGRSPK